MHKMNFKKLPIKCKVFFFFQINIDTHNNDTCNKTKLTNKNKINITSIIRKYKYKTLD